MPALQTLRGHTPKPFLPGPEIWLHIIKVYLKTIRFDTLEIIFEYTHFRSFLADFFTEHYLQSVQDALSKDYIIVQ